MNQSQILQLLDAGQATIQQELLSKHPESKYSLLMLQRSLQIVKNYLEVVAQNERRQLDILENYFQFPIDDVEQSQQQLCADMHKQFDRQALQVLHQLNQLELNIIKAG